MTSIDLPDLAATETLAARVAARARPGDAVLLSGPLGAGKSAFARAMIRSLAGDRTLDVPSPTFTLVQSYATPELAVHHLDLWRLPPWSPASDPLCELGWDDFAGDVVIVEWPDRLGPRAPQDALRIELGAGATESSRVARLDGWDDRGL